MAMALGGDQPREALLDAERDRAIHLGERYFGAGASKLGALALPRSPQSPQVRLMAVDLPDWAADLGVGDPGSILVDPCCVLPGEGPEHARCDWLRAAQLHLDGWLERSVEDTSGPIQSYAFRLPGHWRAAYDRAWANRIFLFLRRLAARSLDADEVALFGPTPTARFYLSHDVDALEKTLQMRIKTLGMAAITAIRHVLGGRLSKALARLGDGTRYAATSGDYWLFDQVQDAEAAHGFRSIFMFADRGADKGFVAWLLDPSYRAREPRVMALMRQLNERGWQVGMHPGFNSWRDERKLAATREEVGGAVGEPITFCRQHWLRFSWKDTWRAQARAGVRLDFTLCFNDRPGFRNGAALRYRPWDSEAGAPHDLESLPTVIMDSHFYDYASPDDPVSAMRPWIDEVIAVGGEASLLWHVHTMHKEIGWGDGYIALLSLLAERGADVARAVVDG